MAQVKVYGRREHFAVHRDTLSVAIHGSLMSSLCLPADKRFQRFISLEPADFLYPADRSDAYTIIEISLFEGRSVETKRALVQALFRDIETACGISAQDVEITIFETPRYNWGIRGRSGDQLALNYKVEV